MAFSPNVVRNEHGTGLKGPDRHDSRDWRVSANARRLGLRADRPQTHDLLAYMPPVYDQGQLGSCVFQAYRNAREYLTLKVGHKLQPLSALWAYYNCRHRFYPQEADQDTGAYLRDGMKILVGRGMALEKSWPYRPARFNDPPPAATYGPAIAYRNVASYRVDSLSEMVDVIAAGWPVALGFSVYSSFYDAQGHGRVPMPPAGDGILGGHAVLAIGYSFQGNWAGGGYILARNSWGSGATGFTTDGNLRFPMAFINDESTLYDAWAIALRTEEAPPIT